MRDSENRPATDLREKGVRGVLLQMAQRGQLRDLRCEMPQCYCPKGRGHFDPKKHPPGPWAPSADHYPVPRFAEGHLTPDNVRLAHVRCNERDYGWRTTIRALLAKDLSLEQIAERLNARKIPRPHGHAEWNAKLVRKAYVS